MVWKKVTLDPGGPRRTIVEIKKQAHLQLPGEEVPVGRT